MRIHLRYHFLNQFLYSWISLFNWCDNNYGNDQLTFIDPRQICLLSRVSMRKCMHVLVSTRSHNKKRNPAIKLKRLRFLKTNPVLMWSNSCEIRTMDFSSHIPHSDQVMYRHTRIINARMPKCIDVFDNCRIN